MRLLDDYYATHVHENTLVQNLCHSLSNKIINNVGGSIGIDYKWTLMRGDDLTKCHERGAITLKTLCKKLGGCYIKFSQHVSSLQHYIPEEVSILTGCMYYIYEAI